MERLSRPLKSTLKNIILTLWHCKKSKRALQKKMQVRASKSDLIELHFKTLKLVSNDTYEL